MTTSYYQPQQKMVKKYAETPLVLRKNDNRFDVMSKSLFSASSNLSPDEGVMSGASSVSSQSRMTCSVNQSPFMSSQEMIPPGSNKLQRRHSARRFGSRCETATDNDWHFIGTGTARNTGGVVDFMSQSMTSSNYQYRHNTMTNRSTNRSQDSSSSNVKNRLMQILAVTPNVIRKSFRSVSSHRRTQDDDMSTLDSKYERVRRFAFPDSSTSSNDDSLGGDSRNSTMNVGNGGASAKNGLLDRMHKSYYGCQNKVSSVLSKPIPAVLGLSPSSTLSTGSSKGSPKSNSTRPATTSDEEPSSSSFSSSPEVSSSAFTFILLLLLLA